MKTKTFFATIFFVLLITSAPLNADEFGWKASGEGGGLTKTPPSSLLKDPLSA